MNAIDRFDRYLEHLSAGLGHADRHAGLRGYCTGLMLPLLRKSVEPIAARVDQIHASARHQALHHFVAKTEWSHSEMLRRIAQWVVPKMDFRSGGRWVSDDTGFPMKGRHSVGVTGQYCGMLGKQDNCQVAMSITLASEHSGLPVAWQLYLPEDWAIDTERRTKAGVPEEVHFATKTQIALSNCACCWPMQGTAWTTTFVRGSATWVCSTRRASPRPSWSGRPGSSRCRPSTTAVWAVRPSYRGAPPLCSP